MQIESKNLSAFFIVIKKEKTDMLQKELAKRLKARYDTKMDGNEWLEEKPMTYINEKHRARFELAVKNIPKANYALLSALYLLTADKRLRGCCKHHN